jgi:hypothetical protein
MIFYSKALKEHLERNKLKIKDQAEIDHLGQLVDIEDAVEQKEEPGKSRDYIKAGEELGKLVKAKNEAYGDSFAKSIDVMRVFYPDGIMPDQYHDALGMIRVIDKQFRIANQKKAFGENPWQDIAGYALLKTEIDRTEDK